MTTATDAQQHLDELKQRILTDGPDSVTAEELGAAAHAVEHDRLAAAHAAATAEAEAQQQRLERLEALEARILARVGTSDDALKAMEMIETGTAMLVTACSGRQQDITTWRREMRAEDVPRYDPHGKQRTRSDGVVYGPATELTDEHAGLGWADASMLGSDAVYVGSRRIGLLSAGVIVASAIVRGVNQARANGCETANVAPLDARPAADPVAINNPDAWLRARY